LRVPGWRSRYSDWLRAGPSGDRIPVGGNIPYPSRPVLEPTQTSVKWIPILFPWGKTTGAWRWPLTQSRAEVKEREEMYLYSSSWPILEWHLPSSLIFWYCSACLKLAYNYNFDFCESCSLTFFFIYFFASIYYYLTRISLFRSHNTQFIIQELYFVFVLKYTLLASIFSGHHWIWAEENALRVWRYYKWFTRRDETQVRGD